MSFIIDKLANEYALKDCDRRTIYDDIKTLNSFLSIHIIHSKNGYYLQNHPFMLAEIKIMQDAFNSLKTIDSSSISNIYRKLCSLISIYDNKLLEDLAFSDISNVKKTNFIKHIEIAINAIDQQSLLTLKTTRKSDLIEPYYLYRLNDYYYLFYSYTDNSQIFRIRFDHIIAIENTDKHFEAKFNKQQIINIINESTQMYHQDKVSKVQIAINDNKAYLYNRLQDDFPSVIINKNKQTAYLKVSVNDVFFGKIATYKDQIKILAPDFVSQGYQDYIQSIINNYRPAK